MKALAEHLVGYFSGGYYFCQETIAFSQAITVWSMFYLKKRLQLPHQKIVAAINAFLGEEIIGYRSFPTIQDKGK